MVGSVDVVHLGVLVLVTLVVAFDIVVFFASVMTLDIVVLFASVVALDIVVLSTPVVTLGDVARQILEELANVNVGEVRKGAGGLGIRC